MTGAGIGGQGPPDGMDAEEAERCPICLGVLAGGELAMPDSCCHVFCLRCLLTWAEMAPSCPVDRRPFTNVYRWDGNLSCVQVPVRKRATQPEAESCRCRNPEQKGCPKCFLFRGKPARRLRRQQVQRAADTKTKGLVRKCKDDDPSSLSRKKVRGTECCTWSPSPCISLTTTSAQDIAEPVWVAEDIPYDTGFKQCKPQAQDCPWLSPAAPIPANGTSRQNFHPTGWNHSPFPFGLCSSPFTSSSLFGPGHFVFQGVVCAITCPKGGEKRGGRASTSKAPTKEAESLPTRRSGRNSKTQEEAPASDPSPPQSSSSESDSSTGQSTKPGRASQVPAKRKGKRVTNRKASGKRKATTRKKKSPEVVCSPAASEEEEEEGGRGDNMEKEEEEDKTDLEQDLNNSQQQQSDAEGSLNEDQDAFNSADERGGAQPLSNDVAQDSDETQEPSDEHEQKPDEGDNDPSSPSDSAPNSPGSCSEGDQRRGVEELASPASSEGKDSEKRSPPSPSDSHNALLESLMSPHSEEQAEQDDNMEMCAESEEFNNEESSKEVKAESCENSPQPASPSAGESEDDLTVPQSKASEDAGREKAGSDEPSVVDSPGEESKEDSTSQDDTKVVPMDCSSPTSEHDDEPMFELPKESASPAAVEPPASASQVSEDESRKDQQERERSQERKNGRQRRSRFHSPSSTWSPKRDSKREPTRRSRSRSRERDGSPPSSRSSRARSRERDRDRDRDGERDYSRRERSRERRRRRSRSRSRSKSRSRSRSRSRTRTYRRGPSPERPASREQSPQRKERRGGWRSGQGSGSGGEGQRYRGGAGRFENGVPTESSPDRQGWSENPDWVTEKSRADAERNSSGGSRWEDNRSSGGNRGEPRGRGGRGGLERGRGGAGRGGSNRSFFSQQDETADSRWQPRNNFSGTGNNSGTDAYSRFNENRGGGRRKESESGESMVDRSGWSSASSWAVRRTLPADVQDYYSKRERGGPGGWNRQEEEQPAAAAAADPPKSEPPPQAVPGNAPVPVMNMIPPQLNVLHHHYPMQGPRGALPVSLQPAAPYAMPPQVPVHLHPAVPLLQVPSVAAQGLPPPPPPPPPMQQGGQTAAAPPDGYTTQMANAMVGYGKPALLPTPTKALTTQGQLAPSQVLPSSTTQPGQYNKAQADSSKKEKKQQIQEKAINEVKTAIKPFYQRKEITKEEYKEIVRKAVEKVCHSKSGEVNSSKVANLVKAYVDKYKHARKK
ncbi:protein SCAF11 isoform X2 [Micropterus salmoides]|uniref:protein SCAF11 isoform X2 n=1 Tax=Micropterus salmoides TaxID=27706 RepID=UPI0018EABA8E|nr:protein SCAF11 isoform X2 [Micropterus salmoides]